MLNELGVTSPETVIVPAAVEAKPEPVSAPSKAAEPISPEPSPEIDLSVLGDDYKGFKLSKDVLASLKSASSEKDFSGSLKTILSDPLLTRAYAKSNADFNKVVQGKLEKIALQGKALDKSKAEIEDMKREYLSKMDEAEKVLGDEMYRLKPSVKKELDELTQRKEAGDIAPDIYDRLVKNIQDKAKAEHLASRKAEDAELNNRIEAIKKAATGKLEPLGIKQEIADAIIVGMVSTGLNPDTAGDDAKEFFESYKTASFDAGYRAGIQAKNEQAKPTPTNQESAPAGKAEAKKELIPPPSMRGGGIFGTGISFLGGGVKKG